MNHTELVMRRRNVLAFIQADPVQVAFTRDSPPTKSAAGGFLQGTPTTLPLQQARIVQNKRRYNNGLVNSEAGDIPHTDYLLIGMHTLDVQVGDRFTWLGEHYAITGIHEARTESHLCSIDLFGKPNHG